MIKALRQQIDTIDDELVQLLHKRLVVMKQIGEAKRVLHQPIRDQAREKEKLEAIEKKAQLIQLPKAFVTTIWKLFFEISEEVEK